jgi:hypothetical protein
MKPPMRHVRIAKMVMAHRNSVTCGGNTNMSRAIKVRRGRGNMEHDMIKQNEGEVKTKHGNGEKHGWRQSRFSV